MIIFNYNKVLTKYENNISYYANRVSFEDYNDHAQEIRLHIFRYLYRFDPSIASLKYFVFQMVITAFRRIVYDRTRQKSFEEGFSSISNIFSFYNQIETDTELYQSGSLDLEDNYDDIISKIVVGLNNETRVIIFFSLLYNKGGKNYTQVAKTLNMNYASFLNHLKYIKKTVRSVIDEY